MPLPLLFGPIEDPEVWSEEILWAPAISSPGIPARPNSIPSGEILWGGFVSSTPVPVPDPPQPREPGQLVFPVGMDVSIDGAPLTLWGSPSGQVPIGSPGNGSVTAWLADAAAAGAQEESLLRFSIGGRAAMTVSVDSIVAELISPQEEAGQTVKISGPGWMDEWRRMVVYPDLGAEIPSRLSGPLQETRAMNYSASTGIDDSAWGSSVVTDPKYGQGTKQRFTRPQGWPDRWSKWIWSRSSAASVPAGVNYFRRVFGGVDGDYQLWVAANDAAEVYLDGILVMTLEGPYTGQAEHVDLVLGNHFHLLAVKAVNRGGRAGLNYSLLPVEEDRLGTPVLRSTASTVCLGYREPPSFTIGKVLRLLLAEAHVRGTLTAWSLSFGDRTDSAGRPWPLEKDLAPRVGIDGVALIAWANEQYADIVASPSSRVLHAYVKDTMDLGSGASFDSSNLRGLTVATGSKVAGP